MAVAAALAQQTRPCTRGARAGGALTTSDRDGQSRGQRGRGGNAGGGGLQGGGGQRGRGGGDAVFGGVGVVQDVLVVL